MAKITEPGERPPEMGWERICKTGSDVLLGDVKTGGFDLFLFAVNLALLKMEETSTTEQKEVADIQEVVAKNLKEELDEGFPNDLDQEFWKNLLTISQAWSKELRNKVVEYLQSQELSVAWFKWGHSDGFPVLVIKLEFTPEPLKILKITSEVSRLVTGTTKLQTACLVHP